MTVQTKHFIELRDILAVRFDCVQCGATLSVKIGDAKLSTGANAPHIHHFQSCPNCGRGWSVELREGGTVDQLIRKLTVSLNQLVQVLHGNGPIATSLGFDLLLEIKDEESSSDLSPDGP